jgi:hypothetical protein
MFKMFRIKFDKITSMLASMRKGTHDDAVAFTLNEPEKMTMKFKV